MLWTARKKHAYVNIDTEADPSQGKGIVDSSLFSWRKLTTTHRALDLRLQLTLKLKGNYPLDPEASKAEIVNHPRCPIFPDNLWTDVLLGCFIDLNKVYSGYYTLDTNYQSSQTIGDFNISFANGSNISRPAKSIKMNGDWKITFR